MKDVYILSGARTAIGTFGGSLKDKRPAEIGTLVARAAIERAGLSPAAIGHSIFGQVIPTEPADAFLSRLCAVHAGVPHESPALTVNRLCGSGLQAILSGAQLLELGDCDVVLAGGAEVMSRAPYHAPGMRWGQRMGDGALVDMLDGVLTDPFGRILMGVTAENVAARHKIDREAQDALAVESHRRAANAIVRGYFREQIVPVEIEVRRKAVQFLEDEHVRADASIEGMAALKPIFLRDGGSVTAGNASGINDGAAALVLATGEIVRRENLKPLARLVSSAYVGVDPAYMGMGPVPATRLALARAQLKVEDLDVVESNEAFAAQACAVADALEFDPAKVNPNGSGIALGHPVGATGAINMVKLVHELRRIEGRYGLVTMCIGGGQGIAAVVERIR